MKVKDLCTIAIFTSIICICSWISIPFVIPFTLQTLGVFLALLILGEKKGLVAILLYLLIGLIGVPVFSGFNGGIGVFLGPTGGFLIGFILIGIIYWLFVYFFKKKIIAMFVGLLLGTFVCYTFGCLFYILIYNKEANILSVLNLCVFPFIIPDLVKLFLSFIIYCRIKTDD